MDKAYLTDWTDVARANKLIAEMIEQGLYKKNQIKKSSNKFKNGKDKKDGYVTRVEVIPGIHPELEVEIKYRGKKTKAVDTKAKKAEGKGNDSFEGGLKIDGKTYRTIDTVMDLEKNEYNFFCTDGKNFYVAKKQNMKGAGPVIAEGPMSEDANHKAWQKAQAKAEAFQNGGRVMQPIKKAAVETAKPAQKAKAKPTKKAPAKVAAKATKAKAKPKAKVVVKPKAKSAKKATKKSRLAASARELMDERMEAARAYGFLD